MNVTDTETRASAFRDRAAWRAIVGQAGPPCRTRTLTVSAAGLCRPPMDVLRSPAMKRSRNAHQPTRRCIELTPRDLEVLRLLYEHGPLPSIPPVGTALSVR